METTKAPSGIIMYDNIGRQQRAAILPAHFPFTAQNPFGAQERRSAKKCAPFGRFFQNGEMCCC